MTLRHVQHEQPSSAQAVPGDADSDLILPEVGWQTYHVDNTPPTLIYKVRYDRQRNKFEDVPLIEVGILYFTTYFSNYFCPADICCSA